MDDTGTAQSSPNGPRYADESSLVLWWPMRYVIASTRMGLVKDETQQGLKTTRWG